ncbi:hypothetical protein SLS63_007064 [Diaporthe eres]|uniref:Uncharacterized protein n=1 Tax=Diaporthe eres TaxID=83184 RepID=A0ABR1P6L7_DIAER
MQSPGELKRRCDGYTVPASQTVPQVQAPPAGSIRRDPYYTIPSRDVESATARQLKEELDEGYSPTTQALVPLGMRFVKILGAGTQGTAVLFEMDDANGATRKIVAKYENVLEGEGPEDSGSDLDDVDADDVAIELRDEPHAMVEEKEHMRRQFIRGYDEDDQDPRMYLMEFIAGDPVPVKEELVPTDNGGLAIPPGDDVLAYKDTVVMIGDYDPDGVVFPHIQVPIFKVCTYFRKVRRSTAEGSLRYVEYMIR